ncbi:MULTISPECIES: hypothetical protein [unclassified Brenneria]|uniref:hypothetical protein n=1 Tax=unclassified Brenneria TaxID=2634434 RepID=UPI0029C2C17D|nr:MULTISPECIES: hypothetical protein [unclassified Brenneria]MDX5630207.1 hypothetical protein [Brenneria sp. L3-3Z]MDX5697352.1 hypothetical protein [Brenneria sp. L4-2C]
MLKVVKWVGLSILSGLILCWLFVYLVASGINETTTYTENDLYNYHTLTEKRLKRLPVYLATITLNHIQATAMRHRIRLFSEGHQMLSHYERIWKTWATSNREIILMRQKFG